MATLECPIGIFVQSHGKFGDFPHKFEHRSFTYQSNLKLYGVNASSSSVISNFGCKVSPFHASILCFWFYGVAEFL